MEVYLCEVNDTRSGINQRSAARYFHSLIIQHVGLTVVKEFVESEWGLVTVDLDPLE